MKKNKKKKYLKKKINKAVTACLKPIGIDKAKIYDEYEYLFDKNLVHFKLETSNTYADIWFNEFLDERFGFKVESDVMEIIMSILHECGHANANEEIEGAIFDFCQNEKMTLNVNTLGAINLGDEPLARKFSFQYFNLPDEIMATQWAVNYAENHPKEIAKMVEVFTELVNKWRELT